jgi:hypothetical protein
MKLKKQKNEFERDDNKEVNIRNSQVDQTDSTEKMNNPVADVDLNLAETGGLQAQEVKGDQNYSFTFWVEKDGKVAFSRSELIRFLENEGYLKLEYSKKEHKIVFVENNIVQEANHVAMIDTAREYLEAIGNQKVIDEFLDKGPNLINNIMEKGLRSYPPKFLKDTKSEGYLFFKNTAVKVTEAGIQLIPYEDLNGYVWSGQIKDRSYVDHPQQTAEYEHFVANIAGTEESKLAMDCASGYLMHSYKDRSKAKAIILLDGENPVPGQANGGTGKSLWVHALSHFKKVTVEDGKTMVIKDNRFGFQLVDNDTQIISIEDVTEDFEFDAIYNGITGDLVTEKKYQPRVARKFEDSPKFVITTNYPPTRDGYSDQRRRILLPVTGYYGRHLSPDMEFEHRFFDDWDEQEWQRFDAYMVNCLQTFLRNGLIQPTLPDQREARLMMVTCKEFPEFADKVIMLEQKMDRAALKEEFMKNHPRYSSLTSHTFRKWIMDWAGVRHYHVDFTECNSRRWVIVTDPNKPNP